ncbi:Slp family lipoprotein [Xenorhabdus bovienii]|uniref:Slp family lipoprotein n=1 Tax=Xenorhabdus bovienii TaxID=40576 RepID=UPI0023B2FBD1|nr:Slp family lipoprotein [Xenorhabdus bovienii]
MIFTAMEELMLKGTHYRVMLQVVALAGAMILTGCVSVPDAIKGTTKTPVENLLSVKNTPELYIGHEGRFGGKVLSVLNEKDRTRLEILALPLASNAAPLLNKPSLGRVYAYVNGFLEPNDFKDQYVTVMGSITDLEKGMVGNSPYNYVVMNVVGFKLWYESERVNLPPVGNSVFWNYYGTPYFSDWGQIASMKDALAERY